MFQNPILKRNLIALLVVELLAVIALLLGNRDVPVLAGATLMLIALLNIVMGIIYLFSSSKRPDVPYFLLSGLLIALVGFSTCFISIVQNL